MCNLLQSTRVAGSNSAGQTKKRSGQGERGRAEEERYGEGGTCTCICVVKYGDIRESRYMYLYMFSKVWRH